MTIITQVILRAKLKMKSKITTIRTGSMKGGEKPTAILKLLKSVYFDKKEQINCFICSIDLQKTIFGIKAL